MLQEFREGLYQGYSTEEVHITVISTKLAIPDQSDVYVDVLNRVSTLSGNVRKFENIGQENLIFL